MNNEEQPAALSAASVKFTVLADGTPRATIDFDPKDADSAYRLCGKPGQPLAVAALRIGHAAVKDEPKGDPRGKLCMDAIGLCNNPKFQSFVARAGVWKMTSEAAKGYVLATCGIESRSFLDVAPEAAAKYEDMKRRYLQWAAEQTR